MELEQLLTAMAIKPWITMETESSIPIQPTMEKLGTASNRIDPKAVRVKHPSALSAEHFMLSGTIAAKTTTPGGHIKIGPLFYAVNLSKHPPDLWRYITSASNNQLPRIFR